MYSKSKCKMCHRNHCACYNELKKKVRKVRSRKKFEREWKKEVKAEHLSLSVRW